MNKFKIKQFLKMFMQAVVLPICYNIGKVKKVNPKLVIFADSHHDEVPYSMIDLYQWFQDTDYQVVAMTRNCDRAGIGTILTYMLQFMLVYAQAGYVFICDNFIPVASCKKRKETTVIQMWHAGGMLKKYAYDTPRDIPTYYCGNVFKNYDLIITSDKNCMSAYISGMRARPEAVVPLGLSRTDRYYNEKYLFKCKQHFLELYPECKDKKIVLWAPTFRGNAAAPGSVDVSVAEKLQEELGDEWYVIVKLHPQIEKWMSEKIFQIPTEELLPVADLLISDYSSVIYDYLLLERPFVFYVPDLDYYVEHDELYIDYNEMPGRIVTDRAYLADAVREEYQNYSLNIIRKFRQKYMGACDGHAMEKLISYLKL